LQTEHHMLNPKVLEPLAIMLNNSGATTTEGMRVVRKFWPQFGENYLARLDSIGLARRDRCLIPAQAPF